MKSDSNKDTEPIVYDAQARESLEALYDSVAQELRNINTSFQGAAAAPAPGYGPYHQAAAVLSAFEINKIRPVTLSEVDEQIEDLLADSVVVPDEPKPLADRPKGTDSKETNESLLAVLGTRPSRWTLLPTVRRRVIEQMRTREAFLRALNANPDRGDDVMQRMIEGYLSNEAPPLFSQDVEQLACTSQVVEWFEGVLDNLPDPKEIAQQLDLKRLLQPFEKLVGQHFSGRIEQLNQLRKYVGVLEPASWLTGWLSSSKRPLMIYGPGGVGKSTLVAKFILQHAKLDIRQRFPYAYLDFDRPGLLAEEPATLLVEAVRQLGIQYPDVREHSERVRRDWQEELALVARQAQSLSSDVASLGSSRLSKQQRTNFLKDFEALLGAMGLRDEPFLLVLDTFEEVQYRSHQYIEQLWDALEELRSIVPRLRTVFSGRAPLQGFKTEEVPLNDLDAAAAKGFLTASNLKPESLVDIIVKRIGGNPLSLRLAVQIFHNEGGASEEFFNRLKKGRIQSALYNRILEHIHDENVMKLAHPGLILRRITPGLILKVLAEPCGVKIKDADEADKLFDNLSKEITLVVPGGNTKDEPRALRHMPEVRRGMIQLLREDDKQKTKVATIQQKAIAYYEPCDDPVSRAEEIYHRLALKQDHDVIAARWLEGVKDHLFNALEELEPVEQAFLAARLGVDVEDSVLAKAKPPDWEVIVGRRAANFLKLRQPDRALQALAQRKHRLPSSPLFALEAQAYQQQMRFSEALEVVNRGLRSKPSSNTVRFELFMLAGRLDLRLGKNEDALQNLLDARRLALEMKNDIWIVEVTLQLLRPQLSSPVSGLHADLNKQLLDVMRKMPDSQLVEHLGLVRNALDKFGEDNTLLSRAVGLVGFESANQTQLRSLGRAVAEWDLSASSMANASPGLLARIAKIPANIEIFDTWQVFMQTAPPKQVKDVMSLLLSNYEMTPGVRAALLDILRLPMPDELSPEAQDPVEEMLTSGRSRVSPAKAETPIALNLTLDERQSLTYALMAAFPNRTSLERMLWYRMNLNLDSISLTDSLPHTVEHVVRYAEMRQLLVQLVTAARESNPGNVYLTNFARKFGLTADSNISEEILEEARRAANFLTADQWRVALGEMSGRVCRIEIGGSNAALYGTGFLVGPNVLVTSYQTFEPVINGKIRPRDVSLRFDFKIYSGTTVNPGTVYRLDKEDWLIASSSPPTSTETEDDLNFALVRLEGVPGREPIGGERAEPGAPPRGWIYIDPAEAMHARLPDQVMLLFYPPGQPLNLVISSESRVRMSNNGTRIYYNLETGAGSSGAPCFNSNWELMGLHVGAAPNGSGESYGVPAAAIIAQLQRLGLDLVGRDKFETTLLRGDRVFLNRNELRQALKEMTSPTGRRILVVNGPPGSGKTYTREYVLEVTYRTPNHSVVYLDLDTADFGATELAHAISEQIDYDLGLITPIPQESAARAIQRLCSSLLAGFARNSTTKWWLIFDGFSKPVRSETRELIESLVRRAGEPDLRIILLNYTFDLAVDLSSRAIREDINPIGREDVEAFVAQQLQQTDPTATSETVKAIVDQVLAATDTASSSEIYPTANRLRLLNRAISRAMPQ